MSLRHMDKLKLKGHARLIVTDPKTGKVVKVIKSKNIICTVGKYLIGDMLIDKDGYDTGLTYCAIGTGTTTPTATDTQLTTEAARKAITSKSRSGKEITLSTFFTAAQSSYNIKEAGIFGHSTAGTGANSGIIFNHFLSAYDNSAGNYDLTFDVIITIG